MPEVRVLLVAMPLSVAHFLSMGLSLLKPAVTRLGVRCDIGYFSLDYAALAVLPDRSGPGSGSRRRQN